MRSRTARTRSSPIAIDFGCSVSRYASQPARSHRARCAGRVALSVRKIRAIPRCVHGNRRRGRARQQREQARELVAQLAAVDDHVERALLEQELGALEALGQLLANRLLDDARTGEADQRARLGDDDVGNEREARRHAAHRRIGQHGHERQPRLRQLLQHGRGLRHLEQRIHALLHARAAGGGHADEGHAVLVGDAHAAHEALADHRAHRAAHELELERGEHERHVLDAALHDDERIGLAGFLERRDQPVRVFPAVLELEAVDRHDVGADLEAAFGIEQLLDPLARVDARVMAALRADVQVLLEVGAVEHRFARRALDPQPLGHRLLLAARRALDARGQEFLQPAHRVARLRRSFTRWVR